MPDCRPDRTLLLQELETRMTPYAWSRLSEGERDAIATIIRGRCAQVIETAFAEFAEIAMRTKPGKE